MKPRRAYLRLNGRANPTVRLVYIDGTEQNFTVYCDQKTAQIIVSKINNEIAIGTFVAKNYLSKIGRDQKSLVDLAQEWLEHREREASIGNISRNTLQCDKNAWRNFLDRVPDKTKLAQINRETVAGFVSDLLNHDKPYSATSINIFLRHLRTTFNWAKEKGDVEQNFFAKFPQMKITNQMPRYMTPAEIETLREYLPGKPQWHSDLFEIAIRTGLRRDGLFNLRFSNIKSQTIRGRAHRLAYVVEKGLKERYVPLSSKVLEIVAQRQGNAPADRIFHEVTKPGPISRMFRRMVQACGLPNTITLHSTRHTFAVNYLRNGGDLKTLSEILGHTSIRTTEIYAKIVPETLVKDIDELTEA